MKLWWGIFGLAATLSPGPAKGEDMTEREILDGASDRIERYRKGDAELRLVGLDGKPIPAGTEIRIEQVRHEFLFGACSQWLFNIHQRENRFETEPELAQLYSDRFTDLLNFCTTQVYWSPYEREHGKPQYDMTEANVAWARKHGMPVKGHPLVWNWFGEPKYLAGKTVDRVLEMQQDRIDRMLKRLKGKVVMWDVVNEAGAYDRDSAYDKGPNLTRAMDEIGVGEFVRKMHRQARESDPTAVLLTNDYVLDER